MLTAQVLALVLTASPLTEPPSSAPEPQLSSARAARFVGALLGGVVGAALPSVLFAITPSGCPGCTGPALLAASMPLLSAVGATLGFALMGGEASVGLASVGAVIGVLLSLTLLIASNALIGEPLPTGATPTPLPKLLIIMGAGAVTIGAEALLLDARDLAVRAEPAKASAIRRFAATVAAAALTSALATALVGFANVFPFPLNVVSGFAGVGLGLAMPLIPFAVHKGQGGSGSLLSAYGGWLAMVGAGLLGGSLLSPATAQSQPLNSLTTGLALGGVALLASVAVPLTLEWSHHAADPPPVVERVTASLAPIPGGGQVMLGGRF